MDAILADGRAGILTSVPRSSRYETELGSAELVCKWRCIEYDCGWNGKMGVSTQGEVMRSWAISIFMMSL